MWVLRPDKFVSLDEGDMIGEYCLRGGNPNSVMFLSLFQNFFEKCDNTKYAVKFVSLDLDGELNISVQSGCIL